MARTDTISSTEKLLDLIRGKQPVEVPPAPAEPPAAPEVTGLTARFGQLFKFRRPATIGVSLGYTDLKLAKIHQSSSTSQELVDYRSITYPPGLNPQHSDFPSFLNGSSTILHGVRNSRKSGVRSLPPVSSYAF